MVHSNEYTRYWIYPSKLRKHSRIAPIPRRFWRRLNTTEVLDNQFLEGMTSGQAFEAIWFVVASHPKVAWEGVRVPRKRIERLLFPYLMTHTETTRWVLEALYGSIENLTKQNAINELIVHW